MKSILSISGLILMMSFMTGCGQGGSSAALPTDLAGFTTTSIANGAGLKAEKKDANGQVIEEGILINDMKNGTWITYYPNKEKAIKSLATYVNNELNGLFLTFSDRGQIETLTTYANGIYDGNFAKFKFGRVEESATYLNGELHGLYKKFSNTNKIQVEAEYKNGKQDGYYRYYDEEGKVVMEYQYKNGEKVSGGLSK